MLLCKSLIDVLTAVERHKHLEITQQQQHPLSPPPPPLCPTTPGRPMVYLLSSAYFPYLRFWHLLLFGARLLSGPTFNHGTLLSIPHSLLHLLFLLLFLRFPFFFPSSSAMSSFVCSSFFSSSTTPHSLPHASSFSYTSFSLSCSSLPSQLSFPILLIASSFSPSFFPEWTE